MARTAQITQKNKFAKSFPVLINLKALQVDSIIFDGFGQACPKYRLNLQYLCDIVTKEVKNEVRNLTALALSNTTLTIYCTSNVHPTIFLSQYGIHTKPFNYLINCLCNKVYCYCFKLR